MARILVIEDEGDIKVSFAGFSSMPDTMSSKRQMARSESTSIARILPILWSLILIMPKKEGIELIIELRRDFPDVKIIADLQGAVNVWKVQPV